MNEISPQEFRVLEARLRRVEALLQGDRPDRHEEATREALLALGDAGVFRRGVVPEVERGSGLVELGWTLVVYYGADCDELNTYLIPNDMIPSDWRSALARITGKKFIFEEIYHRDLDEQAAWILVGTASGTSLAHGLPAYDEIATPEVMRLNLQWQRFETYLITDSLWPKGPLSAVYWYQDAAPHVPIADESDQDADE